jgi:hypothetical protein
MQKILRMPEKFNAVYFSPNQVFKLGAVRFIIDPAVDEQVEVWEQFAYRFGFALFASGSGADCWRSFSKYICTHDGIPEITVMFSCIVSLDDGIDLGFPVIDAIGFPRGQPVFLQVFGHEMRHDTRESAKFNPILFFKHGVALQENHLAVHEIGIAGFIDIMQNGVARCLM